MGTREIVGQAGVDDRVATLDGSRAAWRKAYQEAFWRYVHRPVDADAAALRQAMEAARHHWEAARGVC
jgi:hypothetical protein